MDPTTFRLVDLTHVIVPGEGARPITIERVPAPEAVADGLWYIMHRVEMPLNHVGTHIEAPYHVDPNGLDVSQIPLETLCGSAAVLDLTIVAPGGVVTDADIALAAQPGHSPETSSCCVSTMLQSANNRHFSAEASVWWPPASSWSAPLKASSCRETSPPAEQYNHQLMTAGIPLIEQVAHLNQLTKPRVTVFALPVPIRGLDSFPIRLIALE